MGINLTVDGRNSTPVLRCGGQEKEGRSPAENPLTIDEKG